MRRLRIVLWSIVGIVFLAIALNRLTAGNGDDTVSSGVTFELGGSFSMVDQDGRPVTERTFAGKSRAMFFGFTSCPDICPTTLLRLTALIKKLGVDAEKIQVLFVSVDSERDTPSVIKQYLNAFSSSFVGLTGTSSQLKDFARNYRFFYQKVPLEDGEYTMNHTAGVYLFDPSGRFAGTLDIHEDDEVVLAKLQRLVLKN